MARSDQHRRAEAARALEHKHSVRMRDKDEATPILGLKRDRGRGDNKPAEHREEKSNNNPDKDAKTRQTDQGHRELTEPPPRQHKQWRQTLTYMTNKARKKAA